MRPSFYCLALCGSCDGRWAMVDGRWSMVDGRWSMVDGRWSMVDGRWSWKRVNDGEQPKKVG
ncbi:hypothetical protein [Aeromonas sp. YN13HZO-058]|uniref:hypothetical protein n=1 Tax=Aeromonas sp. YN13HZO-058 TaxID=1921564 RepID=UPI00343EC7CB